MDPYERLEVINEVLGRAVKAIGRVARQAATNVRTNRAMYKQGGLFDAAAGRSPKRSIGGAIRSFSPRNKLPADLPNDPIKSDPNSRDARAKRGPVYFKPGTLRPVRLESKETPETIRKNILKKIDKAANTKEDPNKVAARLKAHYDKQDSSLFGDSAFGRSIQDSFDPSKDPNKKIDQEFGAAKKALKDAGIKFKALQAIGSLDREKNTFNIPQEDMRKARQVLKNFPNAQIKRA